MRVAPGFTALETLFKLKYDEALSNLAFNVNLRPYILDEPRVPHTKLPKKAFTQATLAFG